jgi:hypothetical protein
MQYHKIATVALSGIDKGRTASCISYSLEIFSHPSGFIPSIITHIETGKRWQAGAPQTSENDVFQFGKSAEKMKSIKGNGVFCKELDGF